MKKIKQFFPEDELADQLFSEDEDTISGIQTMLKLTSSNHIKLSEMVDKKANILISVNAIIISVILSVMMPNLQEAGYLAIPSIMFLAVAVCTIIVAIIAIRPIINRGTFRLEDIKSKKINLLFFGNFHKVPLPKYESAMRTMMKDPDFLYSSMIKDIYFIGVVMGKKYRLLRLAYNIFMLGLIISILAFSLVALF
jgi:hypothetical protein